MPIRVLPGVTAAQAVAARAGAPLGGDFAVISLSDRRKPWDVIETRLRAIAEADLVLAIYNPASAVANRPAGRRPRRAAPSVTPTPSSSSAGTSAGRRIAAVTTLGELDPATVDMKCLLLIGARGTRRTAAGQVWTPRWMPGAPMTAMDRIRHGA